MTLDIDVLTLFPAMFDGPLAQSIPGRIQEQGLATSASTTFATGASDGIAPWTTRRTAGERG